MDATRFTNGHTFAGGRIEFQTTPEEPTWRPTLESPEFRERSEQASLESTVAQRRGHRSGHFRQMPSRPWFESIDQFSEFSLLRLEDQPRFIE
jgi:hypothetical protein